jgi:DNA-binding XRE family transcriptional regulator
VKACAATPAVGDRVEIRGRISAHARLVAVQRDGAATVEWVTGAKRRYLPISPDALTWQGPGEWLALLSWPDATASEIRQMLVVTEQAASQTPALSSEQCRAGRQLLGWTQMRLASAAGVSASIVGRLEAGKTVSALGVVAAVRTALEAAEVIFIAENGQGPGVRMRERG